MSKNNQENFAKEVRNLNKKVVVQRFFPSIIHQFEKELVNDLVFRIGRIGKKNWCGPPKKSGGKHFESGWGNLHFGGGAI